MVCRLRYPKSDAPRHHVPCLVDSLSLYIYIFYNISIKSIINLFYIMFSIFYLVCPITLNPIQSLVFLDGQTMSNPGAVPANFSEYISRRAKPSSAAAAMASESQPSGKGGGADAAGKCQSVPIKTPEVQRGPMILPWILRNMGRSMEDLQNP